MTMLRTSLVALAATLAMVAPAAAEQFTLFVYETPSDFASRGDATRGPAYWGAYGALAEAMNAAGIVRGGGPLADPSLGSIVSVRDGRTATDTVNGERDALSGWFVIDVADRAAAEGWAARVPAALTARVEVRPVLNVPMAR